MSLAPSETLVIDTDSWWRFPYCIKYTLGELRKGLDKKGSDISAYNIVEITNQTDVTSTYREAVSRWRSYCGERLIEEQKLFQYL